jgi:hypothetical protein
MLDDLERVLELDTPLALQTRCLIRGLVAGLEEAADLSPPNDPAQTHAEHVLKSLRQLLASRSPGASETRIDMPEASPDTEGSMDTGIAPLRHSDLLEALAAEMFGSAEVQEASGGLATPARGEGGFWRTMQHALLRLSADGRAAWQLRLETATENQLASTEPMEQIASDRDEVVYPPFGSVSGLRLSTTAPLHPRLDAVPEATRSDPAAQLVSALLWFVDHEPTLKHVYRPLYAFGFAAIDERFSTELLERLRRVLQSQKEGDPIKHLRTRIDLDETVHSLTFDPLPAPDSWWRSLQQRSRDRLFELRQELLDTGLAVHLQVLTDRYAEIRGFTKDDLGVDRCGKPGEVVSCLRVYARIDQQVYPGRVIYRRV